MDHFSRRPNGMGMNISPDRIILKLKEESFSRPVISGGTDIKHEKPEYRPFVLHDSDLYR
jgi:hypothetical protein